MSSVLNPSWLMTSSGNIPPNIFEITIRQYRNAYSPIIYPIR